MQGCREENTPLGALAIIVVILVAVGAVDAVGLIWWCAGGWTPPVARSHVETSYET